MIRMWSVFAGGLPFTFLIALIFKLSFRAHRNDMENILPYFIMSLIYVSTNPNADVACNLFRVASVARIIHTLVYAVYPVPQPARILAFATMMCITFYMAAVVALRTLNFI